MMYTPPHFRVDDSARIVKVIRENNFGTVFSDAHGMKVSMLPMLVDDSCTTLSGHLAVQNDMWRDLEGKEVLVVFSGPNHYISPEWYGEEVAVPTWNYVAVQLYGIFHVLEGNEQKMSIIDELTEFNESKLGLQWKADWNDSRYVRQLSGIVAFRIDIKNVTGKWKLSQNHPKNNKLNVSRALREIGSEDAMAIANLMDNA